MRDLETVIREGQETARNDLDLARTHFQDALDNRWPAESRARILVELAELEQRRADYDAVYERAREAEETLRGAQARGWLLGAALLLQYEAQSLTGQDPDPQPLVEALPLLEATDPYRAAQCHNLLGDVALYAEHLNAAAKHFATAYRLYDAAGSRMGPCTALRKLGRVELGRGRVEQAVQYARRVLELADPMIGMQGAHVRIVANELLGDALLAAGAPADARDAYQRALDEVDHWGMHARVRHIRSKMAGLVEQSPPE